LPKLSHQRSQARGLPRWARRARRSCSRALLPVLSLAALLLALPTAASAAIIATVTNGQLVVQSDGGSVAIGCSGAGGNVKINGGDPGTGPALCTAITGIEVKDPSRSADTFDLSAVTAAQFNTLTSIVLDGGENADTLIGSQIADTLKGGGTEDRLIGGAGADRVHGEEGSDTLVWSPGNGNDVLDGDTGTDIAEIDGDGTAEQFTVKSAATAGRVSLERDGVLQLDIGERRRSI
jgi:Ca2+-binding RTX toxin-like protein